MARPRRMEAGGESKAIFDDKNLGGPRASRAKTVNQGCGRQEEEADQLLSEGAGEERLSRRRRSKAIAVCTGCDPRCR